MLKPTSPNEKTVVFGSRLIADKWTKQHGLNPKDVILATEGPEALAGVTGPVNTVRVSEDLWVPPSFPCEKRVKEMEKAIKRINQLGGKKK